MRLITILALIANGFVSTSPSATNAAQSPHGAIDWGLRWRTGQLEVRDQQSVVVIFGVQDGLPVNVAVSNRGERDIRLVVAGEALKFTLTRGAEEVKVHLQCEPQQDYRDVQNRTTVSREAVPYAPVTLTPEDSIETRCRLTRDDRRMFAPGSYRLDVAVRSWPEPEVPQTWWDIEVREPQSPSEKKAHYLAEGLERVRAGDTDGAVSELKRAIGVDPSDVRVLLSAAGAYERLTLWDEAAVVLARVLDINPIEGIDTAILGRRAARAYILAEDEQSARAILERQKVPPDAIERFIMRVRTVRR